MAHTAGNVDKILILHQMYCNVYGMRASKVMVCNGDRNTALMVDGGGGDGGRSDDDGEVK